ncbi:RNA polymerase sigma factor [Cellulomonas biazotea]|uniref:RNA polymerase sigma factor n=1 Tax=Cellulomonas biazotea TaxID=1709 RepID=A0A402DVK4_9CELL|nr:sigma-70 family RNA polymerase sigma factor [Cellulomonas biazotea]GCE78171.1 RNA polymerase sigma factor [Cellulomonas biazotea]
MTRRWEPLLEQVVRERYTRLVARAMLLTASRTDAEDLVQDAVVAAFSSRARFTSVAQAEQYVRRAVVTRFVDGTRRTARQRALVARLAHERPPAEPTTLPGRLEAALATLAPRARACVVLRYLDDASVAETAALLGLSEGAVKRYTSDGVAALDALLGTTSTVPGESVRVVPAGGTA